MEKNAEGWQNSEKKRGKMGIYRKSLHGYKTIKSYVIHKLEKFRQMDKNFESMFEMMFSEKDNVVFEWSEGYKILKMTYGEAEEKIYKKAAGLKPMLDKNDVVGLYMNNSPEWIISLWAILINGKNPLLLNARLDEKTLSSALRSCNATTIITDGKKIDGVNNILYTDIPDGEKTDKNEFGKEILLMSSGTSSHVKVCAYTAEEMFCQIMDSCELLRSNREVKGGCDGEMKLLAILPFYHIFGFVAVYVWFSFFARTFVPLKDMAPQTILNTIKRHKVTHIFSVPLFWQKIYESAERKIKAKGDDVYDKYKKAVDISRRHDGIFGKLFRKVAFKEIRQNIFGESIRFMISGGSGIPEETITFFNAIGYRLVNGYGMTELGITSVEMTPKQKIIDSRSVGKPLSSIEYKIVDGELFVKGDTLAKYIIVNGERHPREEWFGTKDLAEERDGRYYILGRKDDLVVSLSGENLNPNAIEPNFDKVGAIGVCLIGVGEKKDPVLVVSVKPYLPKARLEQIENNVKDVLLNTGLNTLIGKVYYTSAPLISGGEIKLNRTKIRKEYENNDLPKVDFEKAEGQDDELTRRIKEYFASALNKTVEEIGSDADFFTDEGGTSLDYFAMIEEMREEFEIPFPSDMDHPINTVREIKEYVEGKI